MKESRHQKILEIIQKNEIYTQEGILEKLHEAGFVVTQATVSRDIKRLNLIKKLTPQGKYVYASQQEKTHGSVSRLKFQSIFTEAVIAVDYAMNTVVIKCHVGMANAACAALDLMDCDGVVGTLAGDDTIFVLLKTEQKAVDFTKEIEQLLAE